MRDQYQTLEGHVTLNTPQEDWGVDVRVSRADLRNEKPRTPLLGLDTNSEGGSGHTGELTLRENVGQNTTVVSVR